jgi:stage V sporulation protein SpoVS
MTRLSFYDAVRVSADPVGVHVAELNAALTQLRGDAELAQIGIARIEREIKGRIAANRAAMAEQEDGA